MTQKGSGASWAALVAVQVLLLLWLVGGGARAQSSNCTSELVGLSPCLSYISGSSQTPGSSCCTPLASVVQSAPRCLCLVLNGTAASSLGVTINQTRALELPAACNIQTPPVSECNRVAGGTGLSPLGAPTSGAGRTVAGTLHTTATNPLSLSFFSFVAVSLYAAAAFSAVFEC